MSRLSPEELFRVGPSGLEEIGDTTLEQRLDAAELAALRRLDAGYRNAVDEELLQMPESVTNEGNP